LQFEWIVERIAYRLPHMLTAGVV